MSDKEKKELLETIKHMKPEDKAFVTGYAAGIVAKADGNQAQPATRECDPSDKGLSKV